MTEPEMKGDPARSPTNRNQMSKLTFSLPRVLTRRLSTRARRVRGLSDRLVAAQRPLRILEAIRWDHHIEEVFFARNGRELPPVTPEYYHGRQLAFEPETKLDELRRIEADTRRQLGKSDPAGGILIRMCREYRDVVDLLRSRGTRRFGELSARLYGRAATAQRGLNAAGPGASDTPDLDEPTLDAGQAVEALSARLRGYFGEQAAVRVRLSDDLVADAAAGGGYIKVRAGARFTPRQVRLLEVHEGWVHLGTALNGQEQPVCTFLSKGPPSSAMTQEGLAVLTELLAAASYPARWRRLGNRLRGVAMAESGANFRDVYRFFLDEGCETRESYQHTMRIFRGSLPDGCGPFTKDVCYGKGFVLLCRYLRQEPQGGGFPWLPLLFCGKTSLADLPMLARLADDGLLAPPRYVPPPFADLRALAQWTPSRENSRELYLPPAGVTSTIPAGITTP